MTISFPIDVWDHRTSFVRSEHRERIIVRRSEHRERIIVRRSEHRELINHTLFRVSGSLGVRCGEMARSRDNSF
jgi:uncharacterized protein (DUF111 family)